MFSSLSSHPDHLLIRTQELFKDKDDDVPSAKYSDFRAMPDE